MGRLKVFIGAVTSGQGSLQGHKKVWVSALIVGLIGGLYSPGVYAQEKKKTATKSRVVTISEVTIVGRIQKPIAAVDVSRIAPKLTLAELHHPFLQKVEEAIYNAPF